MRSKRARLATVAATAVALLLPLTVTGPAHADTAPDAQRKITLGEPAKVTSIPAAAADRDRPLAALDCGVNTSRHHRTASCSNYRIPVEFTVDGKVVATATLYSKATAELDPRDRTGWKQKVELRLTDPSSPLAWTVSATLSLRCGYCEAGSGGTHVLVPYTTQTFDFTVSSPGRALRQDSIVPFGTFKSPGFDDGQAVLGTTFRPRCDSTPRVTDVRKGGCVYPDVKALYELDVQNPRVDAVAWHVLWAQNNLKHPWGVAGGRYPLHRTFSEDLKDANRDVACVRGVPRPPDDPAKQKRSCDEYPFAQTYEGASKNSDYSCHFLNARDNSREGSLRKSALNGQRVLEHDSFSVKVVNVPSVAEQQKKFRTMGPVGCGADDQEPL